MAKLQLPKLVMRVRFPLPAPKREGAIRLLLFLEPIMWLRIRRKSVGVRIPFGAFQNPIGNTSLSPTTYRTSSARGNAARWGFDSRVLI